MKNPPNSLNKDDEEDSTYATMTEVLAAENRALIAQQEAIELRQKLEGLEALLAKTKENLASAQSRIERKDQEIIKVQLEAHCLSKSVVGLEERFQRLKVLQNVLNEKRKQFGIEFCKTDSNSEASTSDAPSSGTAESVENKDEVVVEVNSNQDTKKDSTELKKEENLEKVDLKTDAKEDTKEENANSVLSQILKESSDIVSNVESSDIASNVENCSNKNESVQTESKGIEEDKSKSLENNSKNEQDLSVNLESKCEKADDSVCCKLEKKCDNQKNEEIVKKETEPSK